jgi:hypothetical protein
VSTNDIAGMRTMRNAKCEERKCERAREVIHKLKIARHNLDMHSLVSLVITFEAVQEFQPIA